MSLQRAIVVGADSQIGKALVHKLGALGCDVIATTRRPVTVGSNNIMFLDLKDPTTASLPEADVAYICAAATNMAECRRAPDMARQVNFAAPVSLARQCLARGTKVVLLSTAAVLDCQAPRMLADRPRAGRSFYGKWKGEAESAILDLDSANVSVLRMSKILTRKYKLIRDWVMALERGDSIKAFDDHRIAPICMSDVIDALVLAGRRGSGIYQVSGASDISYLEAASFIAKARKIRTGKIVGQHAVAGGISPEEVLSFTSLDCSRLSELTGFEPPDPYRLLSTLFVSRDRLNDETTSESRWDMTND